MVRDVRRCGEEAKVRIRQVRREYNEIFKSAEKESDISEDEYHRFLKNVQDSTDSFIKKVEQVVEEKEAEVLEV